MLSHRPPASTLEEFETRKVLTILHAACSPSGETKSDIFYINNRFQRYQESEREDDYADFQTFYVCRDRVSWWCEYNVDRERDGEFVSEMHTTALKRRDEEFMTTRLCRLCWFWSNILLLNTFGETEAPQHNFSHRGNRRNGMTLRNF